MSLADIWEETAYNRGKLMKKLLSIVFACVATLGNAQATPINLDLNLSASDFYFLPHADGSLEADAFPLFNQITVAPGNTLTVYINFSDFIAHLHDISPLNSGIEAVTLQLLPSSQGMFIGAAVTVDLLGVDGDLVTGNQIDSSSVGFNGGLAWQVAKNLTNSEFSFTGARVTYNFTNGNGAYPFNRGLFGFYGGDIRFQRIPEPSTIMLMLTTALGLLTMRAGRKMIHLKTDLGSMPPDEKVLGSGRSHDIA